MTSETRRAIVTSFERREQAEEAVRDLRAAGFQDDEIGWAMREGGPPAGAHETANGSNHAVEGLTTGALTGGVVGALGAAAVSLLVPGIGPLIGGGILATALGGAAAGAAAGGLVGALAGMGVPEEEARFHEQQFAAGRPVVTLHAGDRTDEGRAILSRGGSLSYRDQHPGVANLPDATAMRARAGTDADVPAAVANTPVGAPLARPVSEPVETATSAGQMVARSTDHMAPDAPPRADFSGSTTSTTGVSEAIRTAPVAPGGGITGREHGDADADLSPPPETLGGRAHGAGTSTGEGSGGAHSYGQSSR
jgi:hypothetical protein